MHVSRTCSVFIERDPEQVFDFVTSLDTPARVFSGSGVIPAIERLEVVGGGALRAGAVCLVHNRDGSVLLREITVMDRPSRHAYRIQTSPRSLLRRLVRSAHGEWSFEQRARGTEVSWAYTFELSSIWSYPLALLVLWLFMTRAMRQCLVVTRDLLESTPLGTPEQEATSKSDEWRSYAVR
jgi:Polyketide cyclase / dehydrase and lipid transport